MLSRRPSSWVGLVVSVAAVAVTTLLVYPLKTIAADISLSVVYLVGVLLVASIWGAWLGIATALLSGLSFNYFHIPPTGRLAIAQNEDWVALVVFLIAAVVTSALATVARNRTEEAEQRRREADLAAGMSRTLLRADDLRTALPQAAEQLAAALDLPSAAIELRPVEGPRAFALREHDRQIGTLVLGADVAEPALQRVRERVVPALEALLAAALERDELLSDVVETRALRRSDVLKTALLRAVSHDLRTPLTGIIAASEPLAADHLDEGDRRELASGIALEAERLSRLIDQLLDLSRLEAHTVEARPDWISLDEVLRAAVDDVATPAEFAFSLDPGLPLVRADAAQLERAFVNLLENSARHASGHPVSVRARPVGRRILVRIVDRGPGIPQSQLERVFEPFYRLGDGREGHRGSGLGLAIARGFFEVNGAKVWAESLPEQGTSFVVELPLEPAPAPAAAA